jgi:phosphoglycerate dehydrogenase-like enzyme
MASRVSDPVPVWVDADDVWRPGLEEAVRLGGGVAVPLEQARAIIWAADRPKDLQALLHAGIEWVQLPSAGIEDWFAAGIIDDRRLWTAAKGVYAAPIAEYVIGMLLAGARRLPELMRDRRWQPLDVRTLRGATVGIVGGGGIGSAVIALLRPMGARTVAVTRSGRAVDGADVSVGPTEIDRVVRESDFLVLAAPETAETRGLLDARLFSQMRPHAWLVNVGRGTIVDTQALVDALRDGRLAGAALDVTDPEPLPRGHALWGVPNVVITSHTACTPALGAAAFRTRVQENVRRFRADEPLLGPAQTEHGY